MADLIQVGVDVNLTDASRQRLEKLQNKANEISSAYKKIGAVATAAFAGAAAAITLAVREASKFETIAVQFKVLTGSIESANAALSQLKDFAAKTPFQFEEIANAGKKLLSFGFSVGELQDRLGELGNVAAASGADFGELSLIYGQVAAAGKLTGERLLQLQERAIPIGPALAKTLGVAESSIRGLVSEGKVTTEVFQKAFATLSQEGGFAFGGLGELSATLSGKISTLKDNFSLVTAQIGEAFAPAAKALADILINVLGFFRENPAVVKFGAALLAVATATSAVVGGMVALKLATLAYSSSTIAAKLATVGLTFSVRTLLGATGIGLLIVVLGDLALNFDKRMQQITAVWTAFANNFIKLAGGIGNLLLGIFTFDVTKIKDGLTSVKDAVVGAVTEIANDPAFNDAGEKISDAFSGGNKDKNKVKLDANSQALLDAAKTDNELLQELRLADVAAQNEEQKKFIDDKRKSNETVAKANQFFRTNEFQGTKTALGNLATLTQSKNKSLAKIGQLASIGRATANTAEGFTKALAQGGVIGPILGATVLAAGAAQIATIKAQKFATGGFVGGPGFRSMDSVPTVQRVGEFNVPPESADDVINARAREIAGAQGGQSSQITLRLIPEEFSRFVEATIQQGRALGTFNA